MASILLIDDDEALRTVTAEILTQAGHSVDTAANGKDGLELYGALNHDVIVTDISMPDMDGLELITALMRSTPKPRIIAVSGDSHMSASVFLPAARHLGAQITINKPIRAGVLLDAVARALSGQAEAGQQ
jgi:CheY-like chemotaxis protein